MASELTLRVMERIVDNKLGPQSKPQQAVRSASVSSSSQGVHISTTEESTLKQLINPAKSVQKSNSNSAPKSKTVEEFAAMYNKGKSVASKPVQRKAPVNSQKMNLSDFVQTKKK